jgi:nitroreductase
MNTIEAIRHRISANKFDTARSLSDADIRELVELATEAPSSLNIQHWRFVAVTKAEDKRRLKAVAFDQQKVVDAAVVFIVLGDLRGHEILAAALEPLVVAGTFDRKMADGWLGAAQQLYGSNPKMARDEAIRSASLAAMTLMLAAEAKGMASGPMIGFDPDGVRREFQIPDRYVPVMLLPVGYAAAGNWARKPRLALKDVLFPGSGQALPA